LAASVFIAKMGFETASRLNRDRLDTSESKKSAPGTPDADNREDVGLHHRGS